MNDGNESELLAALTDAGATTIVTPIGGQGFVLGRGNQRSRPVCCDARVLHGLL